MHEEEKKKNRTIQLLRIVGSPFNAPTDAPGSESEAEELYEYASKNRIAQLYLQALKKQNSSMYLEAERCRLDERYDDLLRSVGRISYLLENLRVEHAIFKTVRPYLAATADIDLLVFGREYPRSIKAMLQYGYKVEPKGYGPESATLFDERWQIKIDVYKEIAASHIVYLDKEKIRQYVTRETLQNGMFFYSLKRNADLIAIIGHSVIKEQMYCLGEYYTFLYYLATMNEEEVRGFIDLVKENRIIRAATSYIGVTAILHQAAHGVVPGICKRIMAELGSDLFEGSRLAKNAFYLPHKYHIITVLKTMKNMLWERKFRESVATQLVSMLRPSFTLQFVNEIVTHVVRETY